MIGITRRSAFMAVGAAPLGLAALAGQASAADMTAAEKANVQAVNDFLKAWADQQVTGEKLAAWFTDDASVTMQEGKPPVKGRAASAQAFDSFLTKGMRFDIKVLESFAKGPIVTNSRVDAVIQNGKMGASFPVVGVFVMKDGKIKEWADYVVPKQG